MTFEEYCPKYLAALIVRKRRPVKAATLTAYQGYIRNHIVPAIGELDLEAYSNANMRDLVNTLVERELSPKTIREIVTLVKQIIGSVTDADGNRMYPRVWNNEFIDMPDLSKQAQPTLTPEMLAIALVARDRILYAFLAATGLRIGEALAVRITDDGAHTAWDPIRAVVRVRTSLWQGKEQSPKTAASLREVDLDPRINDLLLRWAVNHGDSPYLFLEPLSTLRDRLTRLGIPGFHCFRRFRITRLRELGTPEDIVRYWAGHAGQGITDRYSKLAENVELRKTWAARSGTGFDIPEVK